MIAVLASVLLGATPITLDEVKAASRRQLDSVRAVLAVTRTQAQVTSAKSVIFPQLDLTSLGVGVNVLGPQRTFIVAPVLDANGQITGFQQQQGFTDTSIQARYSLGVQLTQLLYDGGRWWNQIAQAGAQEEAARGQLAEQQLSSELEAVRRFYELLKQQLALKVFVETLGRSQQQLERAIAVYEAGRGQRAAVFDARTNVGNDEISVIRQRQRVQQARVSLLQWLGQPDADVEAVAPDEPASAPSRPSTEQALSLARKHRPLLASLAANVRAAQLGISVARADFFPRVAASAQYNRLAPTPELFVDPVRQNSLAAGLSLSWDLFSGFQHQAAVTSAEAAAQEQKAIEHQSIVDLEAEVSRTNEIYATELEVLGISMKNLSVAKEQVVLEEERFTAGLGSSLEVRNAQIKLTQAQLGVLQGRADVATARAALERAIGGTP